MANDFELIENPRLSGAKMLNQGINTAANLYGQVKQLQAQQEELKMKKQGQKLDAATTLFASAPKSYKVSIFNGTIRPLSKELFGRELPELTMGDMESPIITNLLKENQEIDKMNVDDKTKKMMKQNNGVRALGALGEEKAAVAETLKDTTEHAGQEPPVLVMRKGGQMVSPFTGETIVEDPTKRYQVVNDPSENPNLQVRRETLLAKNTQALANRIEQIGAPEAITQFATISNLIPMEGDVPGYGRAESLVPSFLLTDKGRAMRQAVQSLQNVKIKDRSGAAVTPPEFVRLKEEFGTGKFKTVDQLRQGLNQAASAYRERLRNTMAGFDEETKAEYLSRNGIEDPLAVMGGFDFGGKVKVGKVSADKNTKKIDALGEKYGF